MLFARLEQKLGSTFGVCMLLLVAFSRMPVHISNMQVIDAVLPIVNYHLIIRLSDACIIHLFLLNSHVIIACNQCSQGDVRLHIPFSFVEEDRSESCIGSQSERVSLLNITYVKVGR